MPNKQKKEYGELTTAEFQKIAAVLPGVRAQLAELPELFKAAPKSKIADILGEGFSWSSLYELPISHVIVLPTL